MNNLIKLKIKLKLVSAALVACSLLITNLQADVLPMPVSNNVDETANTPRQGVDMERVEAKYGAPLQRVDAIGEPPITRWIYPTFTVFFEHDKVLHSVIHRG